MTTRTETAFQPRKTPVQARSAASVEAILEATVQVLLDVGKERLTTTRVAHRAGVSVGTLYQYFPNKKALLQSVLRRHLDAVAVAIERVCATQHGERLATMARSLVTEFLAAKLRSPEASAAMYGVSEDVDGVRIARQMNTRANKAIVRMLATAREGLAGEPQVIATTLLAAMAGVSRKMLEPGTSRAQLEALSEQLLVLAEAYLKACAAK